MGKRSDFKRVEKDYYQTPKAPVVPLVPFLPKHPFTFVEPCAGDGRLIDHIEELAPNGECIFASDIEPDRKGITQLNALNLSLLHIGERPDVIITNPPWSRDKKSGYLLHCMIKHFVSIAPTWLLFDADWMHTKQAHPYMDAFCSKIVSVGRVKWIEDSTMSGKDNCAWYHFDADARQHTPVPLVYGRDIFPPTK